MNHKRIARWVGVLYIIGTAAGILSVVCNGSILDSKDVLAKVSANEDRFILGTLFLLIMGFSLSLVSVIIYPILKKHNEALALGYVVFRGALETFAYMVSALSWLFLVVLSREYEDTASPDRISFHNISNLLVDSGGMSSSILSIIFSLGALMLYYLLFQSKLLPKWLSGWGFIGAIMYLATGVYALFGTSFTIFMMPLALQEMVMAVWLIIKGFNSSSIDSKE